MKMFSKIMLGAMLITSGTAMAQGKSGMHGNNNNNGNKGVIVTERNNPIKSKGSVEANEHASSTAQEHASDRSILNRPARTTVRVRRTYTNNGHHYGQYKHSHRSKTYTRRTTVKTDN